MSFDCLHIDFNKKSNSVGLQSEKNIVQKLYAVFLVGHRFCDPKTPKFQNQTTFIKMPSYKFGHNKKNAKRRYRVLLITYIS